MDKSLEVLDVLDPGLPARALQYVLYGKDEAILLDLRKVEADAAIVLLDQPAALHFWLPPGNLQHLRKHQKRINAAADARARLYVLDADPDILALARYGKVSEAACQGVNLVRIAEVPNWYIYLVLDALVTTPQKVDAEHSEGLRQHWSLDLLSRLLAADERPADDALLLLDRRDLTDHYWRRLESLLKPPGLAERLQEQPSLTRAFPTSCRPVAASSAWCGCSASAPH